MAIYDRWHKDEREDDGTGTLARTGKRIRSRDYGCENRWQVRWRDEAGRQRKKAFALKAAAEQFDAMIKTQLADGSYIDPKAGQVTFRSFAEDWRPHRLHDLTRRRRSSRVSGSTSTPRTEGAAGPRRAAHPSATTR
jgi:hypothetical protein